MELHELLALRPQDYLHDGFYAPDGRIRAGINGQFSLAMAYQLRQDGVHPKVLRELLESLDEIPRAMGRISPGRELGAGVQEKLNTLWRSGLATRSPALASLLAAARPLMTDWKNFAALTEHLKRIASQLALLMTLPRV